MLTILSLCFKCTEYVTLEAEFCSLDHKERVWKRRKPKGDNDNVIDGVVQSISA